MNGTSPTPQTENSTFSTTWPGFEPEGTVCDLWSSKALDLLWLPRCHNWHSPSLHQLASPEAVRHLASPKTVHRNGGTRSWYWRVDPTFGAWAVWAMHRAGAKNAPLRDALRPQLYLLQEHIESRTPGAWAEAERVASAGKPVIPDIPENIHQLALSDPDLRWGDPGEEKPVHRPFASAFLWKTEPTGWFRWYADYRLERERTIAGETGEKAAVKRLAPKLGKRVESKPTGPTLF